METIIEIAESLKPLKKELSDWENEHRIGAIHFGLSVLLIFFGFVRTDMMDIEIPIVKIVTIVVFVFFCVITPYFIIKSFYPPKIKAIRKEISRLEYLEMVRGYDSE